MPGALVHLARSQPVRVAWTTDAGDEVASGGQVQGSTKDQLTIELQPVKPALARLPAGQAIALHVGLAQGVSVIPVRVMYHDPTSRLLRVAVSGASNSLQRREFVRVPVDLPLLTASLLDAQDTPVREFALAVIDLSGGGIKFACDEPCKHDDRVQVALPLDGAAPIMPIMTVLEGSKQQVDLPNHRGGRPGGTSQALVTVDASQLPANVREVLGYHKQALVGSAPPIMTLDSSLLPGWLGVVLADYTVDRLALIGRYYVRGFFSVISEAERRQIVDYTARQQAATAR